MDRIGSNRIDIEFQSMRGLLLLSSTLLFVCFLRKKKIFNINRFDRSIQVKKLNTLRRTERFIKGTNKHNRSIGHA